MADEPDPTATPLDWTDDGRPRSRRFGDVYFSAEDGLAESRTVFLQGCGLPDAWAGRRRFVVGELGFGTGLNIAALLDLWRRHRPADGQLHVFSVEAFPLSATDAARALQRWPEVGEVVRLLGARWPGRARGLHRVELPELSAILDVAVMDAASALAGWTGRADAWFLDGFAPATNPQMWSDEVLAAVAARSAPGARAATFTVAGQVRRGLAAAGFAVEKRPGFGRKRERLEARLPGRADDLPAPRVAIVGGGIAGASAARAVRALGGHALLIEAAAPGAGASGNPAALVTPRLDAALGDASALCAQAFARAVRLYEDAPSAIISRGVLQLPIQSRDPQRFAKLAASDLFEPGALVATDHALHQTTALVIEPAAVLKAWTGPVLRARVEALTAGPAGWSLLASSRAAIAAADVVLLANALDAARLAPALPLEPVRGQASWTEDGATAAAAAWGGYVLPTRTGVLFGATHDRGDAGTDLRPADHARNLELLARGRPELAARLAGVPLHGRAAVRAVTPDRLALAGPTDRERVFALAGFGSRGFAFAPLLAEHVAALAFGAPSPLLRPQAALVDPGRFASRARQVRS